MKTLHAVTAVIELGAGLALLCCPSATGVLLVGAPLEGPASLTVARVGGAGLLALGVACWLARRRHAEPRRERIGRRDVALRRCRRRPPRFRRARARAARRGIVAGGSSPRGDDRLVYRLASPQFACGAGWRAGGQADDQPRDGAENQRLGRLNATAEIRHDPRLGCRSIGSATA